MAASVPGGSPNAVFTMFTVSQALFGVGVGGECRYILHCRLHCALAWGSAWAAAAATAASLASAHLLCCDSCWRHADRCWPLHEDISSPPRR